MTLILALWEKCGLLAKLIIAWAFGPAFLMYMAMNYRDSFKSEIMADTEKQWVSLAAPHIVKRDEQFHQIDDKLTSQGRDIREIRNYILRK